MTAFALNQSDRAVFEAWIAEHDAAVRGYVLALVRSTDVADDVLQDVYRRAWQSRDRYTDLGTPKAYLMRIADHLVCDLARRAEREVTVNDRVWQSLEPHSDDHDPARRLAGTQAQIELAAALERLSTEQRRVLLMRYYGELSFKEIAQVMDAPLNTVLSHCRRGLIALREKLNPEQP